MYSVVNKCRSVSNHFLLTTLVFGLLYEGYQNSNLKHSLEKEKSKINKIKIEVRKCHEKRHLSTTSNENINKSQVGLQMIICPSTEQNITMLSCRNSPLLEIIPRGNFY